MYGKKPPDEEVGKPEKILLDRVRLPAARKDASNPGAVVSTVQSPRPGRVERSAHSASYWVLMGWSSADARSAAECFLRALEIEPENPVGRDGLEWALAELGPEAAQQLLSSTQAAAPSTAAAAGGESLAKAQPARAATAAAQAAWEPARGFRWRMFTRLFKSPFFRHLGIAAGYVLLISTAEVITVLFDPIFGIVLHSSVMLGLIIHGTLIQQGPFRRFLILLALAPLIRLLSLSLPLAMFNMPHMYRFVIVGFPLLLAVFFSARSLGLTASRLYLTWRGWKHQLLFSLVGLLLGTCEYFILRPALLIPSASGLNIAMGIFILFVFTGFLEEIIFRGLMQVAGIQLFGGIAIWLISLLFGILHIGYYSIFDIVFASLVGLFFGFYVLKTQSLLGASLAHGFTNVTLYILLPLLMR